jgi:hypothetical protein
MTIRPFPRAHIAAYVFFLAAALLITWPLLTVLLMHFAGYPFGDAHEMTRHIWWFKYAIQHGQPLIFQPLLGYPDGMQGVILWSDPLQFFPAWLFAFVMPLPAAYNLQCLLTMALNGWAAYFLVWKLTGGRLAALVAGLIFMAAPVMQGHLAGGHGGLLVQWPLPLLAYSLIRLRQTTNLPSDFSSAPSLRRLFSRLSPSTQHLALSTFLLVLLPLGHTLQLIYAGLPLIGVFGLTMLFKREWRALARLVIVVAIGSAILILFLLPVLQSTFATQAYTDEGGGVAFSLDLLGIVTPSFNHPLYGQLAYTRHVLGVNLVEGSSYVGLIAGLLALVGLWKKAAARWWLLLAVVAWILALGPLLKIFDAPVSASTGEYSTFITLPWALVADLPGFNLARTPGRFGFVLALAVAVMAGYGVAVISQKWSMTVGTRHVMSLRMTLYGLLIAVLFFDYQSYWPLPTYSAEIPAAVFDLAGRDEVQAVFNLPWDNVLAAKDALWLQTAHEKPLIAGQVTRKTPVSPAKLTILEQTLDPALLNEAGADVIILHKQYDGEGKLATSARGKLGNPFYEDDTLALWNVPEATLPTQFIYTPPPANLSTVAAMTVFVSASTSAFMYTPLSGWAGLSGGIYAPSGHEVELLLNGNPIHRWDVLGETFFDVPLPIVEPGYYTITFNAINPCPENHDPLFRCNILWISNPHIHGVDRGSNDQSIEFGRGLLLRDLLVSAVVPGIQQVRLNLWWQFSQPRTDEDIRFVKILDQEGNQAAGVDETLGDHPAISEWVETVDIPLNDLSPGTYRVCVGWYSYPDLTRFAVLSDVDGAQDGLACVGEFTIPPP